MIPKAWPAFLLAAGWLVAPAAAEPPATPTVMTMALTGDSIITQRLSPYREPEFLRLIELIRHADLAFTNIEMLFHDYEGYPGVVSGGTYMRAEPALARELSWAGFVLGSRANNHAGDYTHEAQFATDRALTAAGIVSAGTGDNLQQAREARYVDTPAGRVALVSCASTFTPQSVAGAQRSDLKGRPGLSPLRFDTHYVVDAATLQQLRVLAQKLGTDGTPRNRDAADPKSNEVVFQGNRYVAGDKFAIEHTLNAQDVAEITAAIKDAKTMAAHVIVNVHCHESGTPRTMPPDFFIAFAHAAIDAGASAVVGEGPHVLRGIELYAGKPIFYSLGNFIFENDTVLRVPAENYAAYGLGPEARIADFNAKRFNHDQSGYPALREAFESVVAEPVFRGGTMTELKLYPIALGFGRPSGERGRPMMASPEVARKIIADLARLSAPFGTHIAEHDGVGVVTLAPATPDS